MDRAWRIAALAVLLVTGMSWLIMPDFAGFVGGGAWAVLILIPKIGLHKVAELTARQRYASASFLVYLLRFVHPADRLREQSELLKALEFAHKNEIDLALNLLTSLANNETQVGRQAIAQSFRMRRDWSGLLRWYKTELPAAVRQTDFGLQPIYLRALGETGARDEMVLEYSQGRSMQSMPQNSWVHDLTLLPVLAFGGRHKGVLGLFESKLRKLSHDTKEFWIGVSQLAAGQTMAGRTHLQDLQAKTQDGLVRSECAYRLEHLNQLARVALSPATESLLWRIEQTYQSFTRRSAAETARPTKVVLLFIALNLGMFVAECALGGSTNPVTLHQLGALEFLRIRFAGEYWRLFTSLFLHYGVLHLLFNLYALFIIGPGLERAIGSIRFAVCYLLSGLGSGIGVLLLRSFALEGVEQLVGASGCVMGLVGVWAGLLLRHRHTPTAARRLKNILLIVAIQTAFDLSTPQISMAAHMSGLLTGLLLGLLFAPRTFQRNL